MRNGDRRWVMPRWDKLLREVEIVQVLDGQCVIKDPVEGGRLKLMDKFDLHESEETARSALIKSLERRCFDERDEIKKREREIKKIEKEISEAQRARPWTKKTYSRKRK